MSMGSGVLDGMLPFSASEVVRTEIAIHLEDITNLRLIEGLATQLDLTPVLVDDLYLQDPRNLQHIALLVADERAACRYRELPGVPDHAGERLTPALVAVGSATYAEKTLLPRKSKEQPFDGILVLPQLPNIVLAQLSVILYAHRAP